MRLSVFITQNKEAILQAWEDFARTIEPPALTMDIAALRDHASFMLDAIVTDLKTPQSPREQHAKSLGLGRQDKGETYAEIHATQRLGSGYTIDQLVSEYRALRASVLKLWTGSAKAASSTDLDDMTRFNEAIDQALSESVARFSHLVTDAAENDRYGLEAILQAAPVGICMVDQRGKLVLENAENRRIWGEHPASDSIADYAQWKGWWSNGSYKHGWPVNAEEWAMARALRGEEGLSDIVEIEPFDSPGLRKTVLQQAVPIRDAGKNIVGAVVAQTDITLRVRTEAALRESEAKFRTIANAMPQMVWSTLPDGSHDYFNQRWYDFTGAAEGSTDGDGWNHMFHPEDRPVAWEHWRHSLATGKLYEIQYRLRHRSGKHRWVLGRALPVRDELGKIIRWMGTCTDIHDQKLAEEELRESGRRKDEFLAMLAHELRNPLAPISSAAALLTMAGANEQHARRASEIITRQVKHMTNLVDDLLDVSRVTRGLVQLDTEVLDLKQVVDSAVEQAQPLIEARGHQLELSLTPAPAFVNGDKTRLTQVVANLLNNAAKFTPHAGKIALDLQVQGEQVHLRVRDNGSGIEPALLPHIFDLFIQGERSSDRAQGGLGLGLPLVKRLVALHDGEVTATSDGPGRGSVFSITLPLASAAHRQAVETLADATARPIVRPLSLMVVDDNVDARQTLAALLKALGHEVVVMEDGESALAALENDKVQVFILDIGLPGMDGYALARCLRTGPTTAKAVLIALTGYGQAHDRMLSKAAGFDHHFVKPVDNEELAKVLAEVSLGAAASARAKTTG